MLDRRWLFSGVVTIVAFAGLMAMPGSAFANTNITDIDVNGGNSVTVEPSESITVSVTVSLSSGSDWRGTAYRFESGDYTCVDTPNNETNGSHTETFDVTAPTTAGTYDFDIRTYDSSDCDDGDGNIPSSDTDHTDSGDLNSGVTVAYRYTDSASLDGFLSVTVEPGATISAAVTGTISGGSGLTGDWDGTQWLISDTPPGAMSCENTSDNDTIGTYIETFNITAPLTPGVYNAYFRITGRDDCDDQYGSLLTMTGAVTVVEPLGSMTIVKQTLPDGDQTEFTFAGDVEAILSDGESATVGQLEPETYSATELVPEGWDLTDISCDDDDSTGDIGTGTATFNVAAGEDVICTFTNTQRASLFVTKYADPESGEFQFDLSTSTQENIIATHIFAPTGEWSVGDLFPGEYYYNLLETILAPEGWTGTQAIACTGTGEHNPEGSVAGPGGFDFTLLPGEALNCVVNNTQDAVITGKKFEDLDGSGNGVAGPGVSSWSVFFYGQNEEGTYEAVTDENGNYTEVLPPGTYDVCEDGGEGWYQSYPTEATENATQCEGGIGYLITVAAGSNTNGIDFGNYREGSIAGVKWYDEDTDGVLDENEEGLSNWTINLYRNNDFITSVISLGGVFQFTGVAPGDYTLREVMQGGWAQTYPANDGEHAVTLESNGAIVDQDFGNVEAGTIYGYKWHDEDADGYWGEEGSLADWTIIAVPITGEEGDIDTESGRVSTTTTTGENGYYTFTLLGSANFGWWRISEEIPYGWLQTYPGGGSYDVYVDAQEYESGDWNFGNYQYPVIVGYKWEDLDGDGEWDENEPAKENWAVALGNVGESEGEEQPIPVEIVAMSLTGQNGMFSLPVTQSGDHVVLEESQNGWTPTHPAARDSFFDITYNIDVGGRSFNTDSFFDVFVDLEQLPSGHQVQYDDDDEYIRFGNHYTPPETGGPSPETIPQGGANGPPVGPGGIGVGGQVLGASIGPGEEGGGEVLGEATCNEPLLTQYLGPGKPTNDPAQVVLLQNFLNGEVGAVLPTTGYYGPLTTAAVNTFQLKYWQEILAPWVPFGLPTDHTTTGFVGKLTLWKVNSLICPGLNIPVPQIP